MTNKKNRFLTFIFSLIPGAGEMYMGFFKQGLSLMLLVLFVICGTNFLIEDIVLLLPIIWLYSFFHVHHLRGLPLEEFYMIEDEFLFFNNFGIYEHWNVNTKRIVAVILLVMGVILLWKALVAAIIWVLPNNEVVRIFIHKIGYLVPRTVMGGVILYVGFKMLQGNPIRKDIIEHKEEK